MWHRRERKSNVSIWDYILTIVAVAMIGTLVTAKGVSGLWYSMLQKPVWMPPKWVFSVVWTVMYILIAVVTSIAAKRACPSMRKCLNVAFVIQIVLNLLWTVAFFGLQDPKLALVIIIFLLVSIVFQTYILFKINSFLAGIFALYFIWVVFAMTLNWSIVSLNAN